MQLKVTRFEICLFLLVFLSYSYFYNGAAWNHNSRLNVIFAFVEPETSDYLTFRINRFITDPERGINTGDWSRYQDNYYSNKAPGIAMMGIPFYFMLYHGESILGVEPGSDGISLLNAYLIHLWVTVLPLAISAIFFYRILTVFLPADPTGRLMLWIALYWCTLLFPFSTQVWGHSTAAAGMTMALYYLVLNDANAKFFSGLFLGVAILVEYSCAIALLPAILVLARHRSSLARFCLGGLIPFLLFISYHKICFGGFFTIANIYNNPHFLTNETFGTLFGAFRVEALWGLTFSPYRGLFFYLPWMLLAIPGLYHAYNDLAKEVFWIGFITIVGFMVMNISFNGWHGGACTGPRYQIPALPFYALIIIPIIQRRVYRLVLPFLMLPSFLNMLFCTIISPIIRTDIENPLLHYYTAVQLMLTQNLPYIHPWTLPIRLQSHDSAAVEKFSAFNWGELWDLLGIFSLLPWLISMMIALSYLHWKSLTTHALHNSSLTSPTSEENNHG